MPSSCGRCGATPLWATTGRVSSACLERPLHPPVEDVLFHVGSCCPSDVLGRRRRTSPHGPSSTGRGSLCAHHTMIDGWWPSRSTARAPGARPACGSSGRTPTAAGSPARRACRARRRRRTARGGRCGRARARGRGRRRGRARCRARSSAGRRLAERQLGRRQVGALHEHPLAVDREHPVSAGRPRAARCGRRGGR